MTVFDLMSIGFEFADHCMRMWLVTASLMMFGVAGTLQRFFAGLPAAGVLYMAWDVVQLLVPASTTDQQT